MSSIPEVQKYIATIVGRIEEMPQVVRRNAESNRHTLLSLQHDQLLLGRDTSGNLFTPKYTEDPFFETKEQAKAYSNMKYFLLPMHNARLENPQMFANKPKDTPNLIVTGPFHESIDLLIATPGSDAYPSLLFYSNYAAAGAINAKYNNKVLGLAPKHLQWYWLEFTRKAMLDHLNGRR